MQILHRPLFERHVQRLPLEAFIAVTVFIVIIVIMRGIFDLNAGRRNQNRVAAHVIPCHIPIKIGAEDIMTVIIIKMDLLHQTVIIIKISPVPKLVKAQATLEIQINIVFLIFGGHDVQIDYSGGKIATVIQFKGDRPQAVVVEADFSGKINDLVDFPILLFIQLVMKVFADVFR